MQLTDDLLDCPNCEAKAEYYEDSDYQAAAIYCSNCPLGVERSDMTFKELQEIWNNLPRRN